MTTAVRDRNERLAEEVGLLAKYLQDYESAKVTLNALLSCVEGWDGNLRMACAGASRNVPMEFDIPPEVWQPQMKKRVSELQASIDAVRERMAMVIAKQ